MNNEKVLIPMVQRIVAKQLADQICGVKPMSEEDAKVFTLDCKTSDELPNGTPIHDFINGYGVSYNGCWMSHEEYDTLIQNTSPCPSPYPCPCWNVEIVNHDDGSASCIGNCPEGIWDDK